ncbi:hypothetical protein KCP69_23260 [Salmonella enterica subsp. enterica]|nr:hypothetical protein KCP69_23260 [Salmonella enterica subsp. enterica]
MADVTWLRLCIIVTKALADHRLTCTDFKLRRLYSCCCEMAHRPAILPVRPNRLKSLIKQAGWCNVWKVSVASDTDDFAFYPVDITWQLRAFVWKLVNILVVRTASPADIISLCTFNRRAGNPSSHDLQSAI